MTGEEDQFWNWVRDEVARSGQPEESEYAAIEEQLREAELSSPAELPAEKIDAMVAAATGATLDSGAHTRPAAPVHRLTGLRRLLGAAAAVLIAPKFLVAATAATAIAVTALVLQDTTRSLPYQDAIAILLDESNDDAAREAAQGRVFFDIIESITLLQTVADQRALSAPADACLLRIRDALDDTGPFSQASFSTPLIDLRERAGTAGGLAASAQRETLQELTDQTLYGIRALQAIADSVTSPQLLRHNEVHLRSIRSLARP